MKKILIGLFLAIIVFTGYKTGTLLVVSQSSPVQNNKQITATDIRPIEKPQIVKIVPPPILLSIPSIGITAPVEQVGLDEYKRMDVPKDVNNVGWYNLGFKPGEKGNAVMAGHLDTQTGAPAIFFNLAQLNIGDTIYVTDEQGKKYIFKVVDKQTYDTDNVPLVYIFGESAIPRLNLITCEGIFNTELRNYSKRTVIYSELVDTTVG